MIEVTLNHSPDPFKMRLLIIGVMSERLFAIAHAVRLDVSLIYHIKTISVTQRIPKRIIRVMTCPDCIDIELLHDLNILYHVSLAHHISLIRVHLMTVRTLDKDRLAVHQELAVLYSHIPETNVNPGHFCKAVLVVREHLQPIEPRCLGSPCLNSRHIDNGIDKRKSPFRLCLSDLYGLFGHSLSKRICNHKPEFCHALGNLGGNFSDT